jgi:hypothetical protein
MIKDFNDKIILTTQEPGAFVSFRYEDGAGDPSLRIIPRINPDINLGKLWINGIDISQDASIYDVSAGYGLKVWGDPSIAAFHIYTRELSDFSYNVTFDCYEEADINPGNQIISWDVSILNRPFIANIGNINVFETGKVQIENESSYLILRTNPKFSGNIKIIIDSSNSMYLDTFKISNILSNKKYRKQSISSNSVYASDVRNVFSSLPKGELYKLDEDDTLNVSIPKTDIYEQYNTTYSYGARLFEDDLYDNEYSLLAPLWINKNLPDYFAIFRLDGAYNEESYDGETSNLVQKFFSNSTITNSWGLKEGTHLGNYLRNHLNDLNDNVAPLFLSLTDPSILDADPNTWYGIAVDKGILAGRSETTYFFDQKSSNFTDMNGYVSEGFERLNLLCPNLINLEYSFDSGDVSLYSMHRYFGLYLTENPLYTIAYYADSEDSSVRILSLDGKDSSNFFNSNIFDSSGNISSTYANRIFTLDDLSKVKRITTKQSANGELKSEIAEWINKPGDGLFTTKVEKIDLQKFFSFKVNKILEQGEHLRFIDKTTNKMWEIFGSNSDELSAGESWSYASTSANAGYPTVFRTMFSSKGNISDQINAIKNAWNVFIDYEDNCPVVVSSTSDDSISFYVNADFNDNDIWFQRLTPEILIDTLDPSGLFNTAISFGAISIYGSYIPDESNFEQLRYDSSYGPIDFEYTGDRMSTQFKLFDATNFNVYSIDSSLAEKFDDFMLYLNTSNKYKLIKEFNLENSLSNVDVQYANYVDDNNKILVITEDSIYTIGSNWNVYSVSPVIISLMGVNPIKDFDYTVYDKNLGFDSQYTYAREGDANTYEKTIDLHSSDYIALRGSYEIIAGDGNITIDGSKFSFLSTSDTSTFKFNTFDASAYIVVDSSSVSPVKITYTVLDGIDTFDSYNLSKSEELIADYYKDASVLLKYGLTTPYVTKWATIGNDCRSNPLRLMLDGSMFNTYSSNFIPTDLYFSNELSYPSFKYLSSGVRNWKDYVFYDINDSIEYSVDNSLYYTTFKNLMINEPTIDVFSKILYSNYLVDGTFSRSSIAYYNQYTNTISCIVNGLSLSLTVEDTAKNLISAQTWDKYRISFVSMPSRNRDNNKPIEIIINENIGTILIVWYQGNDVLNFNKRNSSIVPGKNLLSQTAGKKSHWEAFMSQESNYSYVKTPFWVNTSTDAINIFNVYDNSLNYLQNSCTPFAQFNMNIGDSLYSIFNAYKPNVVISEIFNYTNSYDTFSQYVDYTYVKEPGSFASNIVNIPYTYETNENLYANKTCSLDIFKYLIAKDSVYYYVIKENNLIKSSDFILKPISISINEPNTYKNIITYNGWYTPSFNNVLSFNANENSDIINILEKDFIACNTNINSCECIPQLWYNKVVNNITAYDVSAQNAINFAQNYDVFSSQWDAGYYKISNNGAEFLTNGYLSDKELPAFFGSKLVKFPKSLILDTWDNTTAYSVFGNSGSNVVELQFNLSKYIAKLFKREEFTQNWAGLTTNDSIIDKYIKNTVLNYYNISKTKIKVEIWTKSDKNITQNRISYKLAYELSDEFVKWEGANIDSALDYVNTEYIYKVRIQPSSKLIYYFKITLFEK